MAEAGDGNIKVVVRCRPLNSRGAKPKPYRVELILTSLPHHHVQNLREARSHSFACPETKLS